MNNLWIITHYMPLVYPIRQLWSGTRRCHGFVGAENGNVIGQIGVSVPLMCSYIPTQFTVPNYFYPTHCPNVSPGREGRSAPGGETHVRAQHANPPVLGSRGRVPRVVLGILVVVARGQGTPPSLVEYSLGKSVQQSDARAASSDCSSDTMNITNW